MTNEPPLEGRIPAPVAHLAVPVFDVPADLTAGTLLIHPDGRLIVTGKLAHGSKPPPIKRIPLTVTP